MTDIVKQLAALPGFLEHNGIVYRLVLFQNHPNDFRLCYENDDWWQTFDTDVEQTFLYLYENISDESDLRNAIADCREFLISTNIWKP